MGSGDPRHHCPDRSRTGQQPFGPIQKAARYDGFPVLQNNLPRARDYRPGPVNAIGSNPLQLFSEYGIRLSPPRIFDRAARFLVWFILAGCVCMSPGAANGYRDNARQLCRWLRSERLLAAAPRLRRVPFSASYLHFRARHPRSDYLRGLRSPAPHRLPIAANAPRAASVPIALIRRRRTPPSLGPRPTTPLQRRRGGHQCRRGRGGIRLSKGQATNSGPGRLHRLDSGAPDTAD